MHGGPNLWCANRLEMSAEEILGFRTLRKGEEAGGRDRGRLQENYHVNRAAIWMMRGLLVFEICPNKLLVMLVDGLLNSVWLRELK